LDVRERAVQTKNIATEDALLLSSRQEDHFYDRKAAAIRGAKLQKVAVAFANADGGEIYVGISDDKDQPDPSKRWCGAAHIEDYNQHIQALSEVQPALPMDLTFLKAEGTSTYVLRIQVEKSQAVHKTADGTVYERKGAQSLPVSDPGRITALSFAKGAVSFEDYPVDRGLKGPGSIILITCPHASPITCPP
jgi:ATP-dependent DNA helicase RecG